MVENYFKKNSWTLSFRKREQWKVTDARDDDR